MNPSAGRRCCLYVIASCLFLLSACGGGSSGGSGNGSSTSNGPDSPSPDIDPTTTSLGELDGLTGDADNHDLLYFTQSALANDAGLFSINPATPDAPVQVDAEIGERLQPQEHPLLAGETLPPHIRGDNYDRVFFPIHEGELDSSDDILADFRIVNLFYLDPVPSATESLGYRRVTTDPASQSADPIAVSAETFSTPLLNAKISYALDDVTDTAILNNRGGTWVQFRLGDDDATAALELDDRFTPVAPVFDPATKSGAGYLAIDSAQDDSLRFLDMTLEPVGAHVDAEGAALENIALHGVLGGPRSDGSLYVALYIEDDDAAHLWHYEPEASGPGTIELVRDADGDALDFPGGLLGGIATPEGHHVAYLDGDAFFLHGVLEAVDEPAFDGTIFEGLETVKTRVIRLSGTSWTLIDEPEGDGLFGIENAFLVSAGGRLVYEADGEVISIKPDGSDRLVLDSTIQDIEAGLLAGGNGWVFYHRTDGIFPTTDLAVAARADGSERIDLANWRWVGASTSAVSESSGASTQLDSIDVSEVFLVSDDHELAAISTSDPLAGLVNFGSLPNSATGVQMFGLGPGPHRLAQTTLEGEPDSYEVIYLNTRDGDSMQVISAQASTEDNQRPVSGF